MNTVIVNGMRHEVLPLSEAGPELGSVLLWRDHRRVYRLLCRDGDEYVMRNVRHPTVFEAFPISIVEHEFCPIRLIEADVVQ